MTDFGEIVKTENYEESGFSVEWHRKEGVLSVLFSGTIEKENNLQALQDTTEAALKALEFVLNKGMSGILLDYHNFFWTYHGEEMPSIQSSINVLEESRVSCAVIVRDDPHQKDHTIEGMEGRGSVFHPGDPAIARWISDNRQ